MTISQFYVDTMQKQKPTLKALKDHILNDLNEVGDLIIIVSRFKSNPEQYIQLGYIIKNHPKHMIYVQSRWIALKLFFWMKFYKRTNNADGS